MPEFLIETPMFLIIFIKGNVAVTGAYINTCSRIFGARIPKQEECLPIAAYNGIKGGEPSESIKHLENKCKQGVQCRTNNHKVYPSIETILKISVIVSFTKFEDGWKKIAQGELLTEPEEDSKEKEWHANFGGRLHMKNDYEICKNSSAKPQFSSRFSALYDFQITEVYFTLASIPKTLSIHTPNLIENEGCFKITKDWIEIQIKTTFYEMEQQTAIYESNYICKRKDQIEGFSFDKYKEKKYDFIGFPYASWISARLNRK